MTGSEVLWLAGKKYMWDGLLHETKEAAEAKRVAYEAQDFETHLVEASGKFLVYTRRVVTEIVLEGEAPI